MFHSVSHSPECPVLSLSMVLKAARPPAAPQGPGSDIQNGTDDRHGEF